VTDCKLVCVVVLLMFMLFVLLKISNRAFKQMDLKLSSSAAQFDGLTHIGNVPCFKVYTH